MRVRTVAGTVSLLQLCSIGTALPTEQQPLNIAGSKGVEAIRAE